MHRIATLLACCLALPACTSSGDGRSHLADSQWRFVTIDGAAPATPEKAHLRFEADHLGANVGCNGMGGPWSIEDGRLIAGPLVQTQMFCEGPVWDQERAVSALLSAAPRFIVEGDRMDLQASGHSARLERIANPQP